MNKGVFHAGIAVAFFLGSNLLVGCGGRTGLTGTSNTSQWTGTWGSAPDKSSLDPSFSNTAYAGTNVFQNQTLRVIAHISIGGTSFRVRLSNELGTSALQLDGVHIALQSTANQTVAGTDMAASFGGQAPVSIPAGSAVVSDAIPFSAAGSSNLAVSIYLNSATLSTTHVGAEQSNYVSPVGSGNLTATTFLTLSPASGTILSCPLLTAIEVQSSGDGAIVAFGASATDGQGSTISANRRWPNLLADRLQASGSTLSVVDEGLAGNRLLANTYGPSGVSRFSRDALGVSGVRYIILTDLPLNDIGDARSTPTTAGLVPDIITGYQSLIAQAHAQGLKVIGATLLPIGGSIFDTTEDESKRDAMNTWIMTSGAFDGIIDFNAVMHDTSIPQRLLGTYDSGDHLHPNDAGYTAMAQAISLSLFTK